jgi:hypothetical protein
MLVQQLYLMAIGDNNIGPDRDGGPITNNSSTRSGGGSMMGGLIGGWFQNRLAKKQRAFEEQQRTLAYERSLPFNSTSAYGRVSFDPKTKEMLQELSPEMQELMGNWLGLSNQASQEMLTKNPDQMAEDQYNKYLAFNEDEYNETRLRARENAIATGRGGGTQGYYDQLAVDAGINKDKASGLYASVGEGMKYRQQLADQSSMFGQLGRDVPNVLDSQRNAGITAGAGANLNTLGDMTASRNYTDTQSNFLTSFLQDSFTGRDKLYNEDGKVIQDKKDPYFSFLT